MTTTSAAELFHRYFYLLPATAPGQLATVYNIRYQVYCREFGYEREEDCPDQMEQDEYDQQSQHCLLIHKPTGTPAGCVRLVLPDMQHLDKPLPFLRFCREALDIEKLARIGALEPGSCCEVSRLAVLPAFRRRKGDEQKPISLPANALTTGSAIGHGRSNIPIIPVALFLAAAALFLGSDSNRRFAVAMMEPRLARMLRRFGILFTRVGKIIDYHGPRGPYIIAREEVLPNIIPDVDELLKNVERQVTDQP